MDCQPSNISFGSDSAPTIKFRLYKWGKKKLRGYNNRLGINKNQILMGGNTMNNNTIQQQT